MLDRKKIEHNLQEVQGIIASDQWKKFREFCEINMRALFVQAIAAQGTEAKLAALSEARALFELCTGFENEAGFLAHAISLDKFADDERVRQQVLAETQGQPRPYTEPD